jgi:class 3 adenylate cyclase/CHASE2 domain-containing sensor protein
MSYYIFTKASLFHADIYNDITFYQGRVRMEKSKKHYFSLKRIAGLVICSLIFYFLPSLLTSYDILPSGAEFIGQCLISGLFFIVLFDKTSFRVGVILVVFLASFSLYQPIFMRKVLDGLNNRMQDAFFVLRGHKKPSKQVVIVDIDQRSLETVGQWPWPRSESARVVQNVFNDGARVVGFDIVYAEEGRFSLEHWIKRFDNAGIQLTFPGKTLEETDEEIDSEMYEFRIPGPYIESAVLAFWEERFEELYPEFYLDTEDPKERKEILMEQYLVFDKSLWHDNQEKKRVEMERAGIEYSPKPYITPSNILLTMARECEDLFFVDSAWESSDILDDGAAIISNNDEYLGYTFSDYPVVAGGLFILEKRSGSIKKEPQAEEGMVLSAPIWDIEKIFPALRRASQQVLNVPNIQDYTNFQGMFNIVPDKSGAARFYTMLLQAPIFEEQFLPKGGKRLSGAEALDADNYEVKIASSLKTYPAIALQMLRVANGYNYAQATYRNGQSGILLRRDKEVSFGSDAVFEEMGIDTSFSNLLPSEMFIPLDFKGDLRVNYLSHGGRWHPTAPGLPEEYIQYVSISDVLYKKFPPGTFKDKYVLLGSTDPTLSDLVGSPFRPAFPGLEVHATMLENLISQDFLIDLGSKGTLITFLGILYCGILLCLLIAYTGPWASALFMGLVLMALPTISYYGLAQWGVVIEFVYPWLCTISLGTSVILINFFVEGREKRFLNATFKNYLSPELIDMMVDSGAMPKLGGEENVLTAYFTDIQAFSTFSEKLGSPTKLVELLNEYLSAMTDILLERGGTLDKYEGDAIIAFFGAPLALENHAHSSCISGLAMQDKLDELRTKWASEGDKWPEIVHNMRMRVGINSGPIVTGNMGSKVRMNYTMMGDTVNLAARLESGAKQYGVFTLCSEETLVIAKGDLVSRLIDRLCVVGKSEPVKIYELLHKDKGTVPPEILELVKVFTQAREYYEAMEWDKAIETFEACLPLEPHHPERAPGCKTSPSHVFIQRCKDYRENPPVPPGETWDGVYVATSK